MEALGGLVPVVSAEEPEQANGSGIRFRPSELEQELEQAHERIRELELEIEQFRSEFIDIGWASFRRIDISVVGVWAEQKRPGEDTDPEAPHLRVFGETFELTYEELLYMQRALGIPEHATDLHDKWSALVDEHSCLNRAKFGEPIFILRGQDATAPKRVRDWATEAEELGAPAEKVTEARLVADLMEQYPGRKNPD